MIKRKEVILFLVEGFSDKEALEGILSKLVSKERVLFHVMNGDLTSDRKTKADTVIRKVGDELKQVMSRHKLQKTDICRIIHMVDADGVFIPDSHIQHGEKAGFQYTAKDIIAKNRDIVKERNAHKAGMLEKLVSTGKILGIPYRVFFMSCNLDHVLYGIQNLENEKKVEYADAFYENYQGKEGEFVKFICGEEVAVDGEYKDTWKFIECDLNSLSRCSNLCLFFRQVAKITEIKVNL